jgi:hypothetical protein
VDAGGNVFILGTFQALEALALGIWGKRALCSALGIAAGRDASLQVVDFAQLEHGAEAQHARVEERRLQVALTALGAS